MATTFSVGGVTKTLTAGALTTVEYVYGTAINSIAIVITDAGATAIKADLGADTSATPTTARTSGTSFTVDFSGDNKILNILVDTTKYSLTVVVLPKTMDKVSEMGYHVGWFAARCITGDFDAYDDTNHYLPLDLGCFKPKYFISLNLSDTGCHGRVDLANKRLYMYKSTGAAAVKSDLASVTFSLILME